MSRRKQAGTSARTVAWTGNQQTRDVDSQDDPEASRILDLTNKIPELGRLFDVHRKIGEGAFGSVYLASLKSQSNDPDRRLFAIKYLVPTCHPSRMEHELRCLKEIGGKDHVIGVELCVRNMDNVAFVMPYVHHRRYSDYVGCMSPESVRCYLRALLRALRRVHSFGVIHRDVKPSNFLYDHRKNEYVLVDFGLAQRILPDNEKPPETNINNPQVKVDVVPPPISHAEGNAEEGRPVLAPKPTLNGVNRNNGAQANHGRKRKRDEVAQQLPDPKRMAANDRNVITKQMPAAQPQNVSVGRCVCWGQGGVCAPCLRRSGARAARAGTQGFRPPEVLLKQPRQTTAVDIWAAGVIALSLCSGRHPLLRGQCDLSALAEVGALLGAHALQRAAIAMGRRLILSRMHRGLCLRKLCSHLRGVPPVSNDPQSPQEANGPRTRCHSCREFVCLCRDDTPQELIDDSRTVCGFPDSLFALTARLLDPNPHTRITAEEALQHPYFQDTND